ncbi:MAG: ribonuclease P protein component [Oscillospiraceae bacterium]|nr:ribonuclease P protein component [Oscillospiraceae bacterium]
MRFTVSLKKNHEFRRLYSRGKNAASRFMVVYCRRNGRAESRVGITVSGKLGGAVRRNRMRRRLKETYRLCERALSPGYDIVIVARQGCFDAAFGDLTRDFMKLTRRLGISVSPAGARNARGGGNAAAAAR